MMSTEYHTVDPNSYTAIIRKPKIPSCFPIPGGKLEIGTKISIFGSMNNEDPDT